MADKKLGPTEFEAELQNLRTEGKLPSLDEVLAAVADSRKKYSDKILAARGLGEDKE
jgi:hypothetical protein